MNESIETSNKLITIKCYFNSILNKSNPKINEYKQLILSSIKDINIITSLLYDYIKLKILFDFNHNNFNSLDFYNRTDINRLLIALLKVESIDSLNKNKRLDQETKDRIIYFIHFINNNKLYQNIPSRNKTTAILKEVLDNMIKNIKVNIQEHYIQHLLKFIKLNINNYDNNKENKLKFYSFIFQKDFNQNNIIIEFNQLSKGLKQFYNDHINIFKVDIDEDVKKKIKNKNLFSFVKYCPLNYLKSMYLINKFFEDYNNNIKQQIELENNPYKKKKLNSSIIKLFNILPSKNNYYNGYVPFSTSSISSLLSYTINKKVTKIVNNKKIDSYIQDIELINKMYNDLFNFNKIIKHRNIGFSGYFYTEI